MGHTSLSMTDRYVDASRNKAKAVKALDKLETADTWTAKEGRA